MSLVLNNNNDGSNITGWGGCACIHCEDDMMHVQYESDNYESDSDDESNYVKPVSFVRPIRPIVDFSIGKEELIKQAESFNKAKEQDIIRIKQEHTDAMKEKEIQKNKDVMQKILDNLPKFSSAYLERERLKKIANDKAAFKIMKEKRKNGLSMGSRKGKSRMVVRQMNDKGCCVFHPSIKLSFKAVWDHGKFVSAPKIIECDLCKVQKASDKKDRQVNNKIELEENHAKRMAKEEEIKQKLVIMKAMEDSEKARVEKVEVVETDEEIRKRELIESYNKHMEKERELVRSIVRTGTRYCENDTSMYCKETKELKIKEKQIEWIPVNKVAKKNKNDATMLTKAFYSSQSSSTPQPRGRNTNTNVFRPQMHTVNKPHIMCKSVKLGKRCAYPPGKCTFAHTSEELYPKSCSNKRCRLVAKTGGKFINNGYNGKVCMFLHEGETKTNMCERNGIAVPKVKLVVVQPPKDGTLTMTQLSSMVLKPYSKDRVWGPIK